MKYTLKKPIILWCFVFMAIMGSVIGYNFGEEKGLVELYSGIMAVITNRYAIIVITLITDYLVFSNLNSYVIICRYKSTDNFILKAMMIEMMVIAGLAVFLNMPILLFNMGSFFELIALMAICIINMVIVMMLFTSIVCFINIWFNNRAIATGIIFAIYVAIDFLVENVNFLFLETIVFDFSHILNLPLVYGLTKYVFIMATMISIIILLTFATTSIIGKRDYLLNVHENS